MSSVGIPGDPGQLLSSADQFAAIAQHLDDTQNQILGASNQATSSWQSQGAFAFTGASNWLQASVSNAGEGFEQAAIATRAYGTALQQAQDGWNKCNQELHQLQSDLQTANAQLAQAEATNAQRTTANMAAAVFTAGLPSVSLGGLSTAAPSPLPMINTTPMQAHIDQLRLDIQRVQAQMHVFETDAEQAARTYAGTLGGSENKSSSGGGILGTISGDLVGALSGVVSSGSNAIAFTGQQYRSFMKGLVGGLAGGAETLLKLGSINSLGMRTASANRQDALMANAIANNPEGAAKAFVDLNTLEHNPSKWLGEMAPLAVGGLGVVSKVDRMGALSRVAQLDELGDTGYAGSGFHPERVDAGLSAPAEEYGPIDLGNGRQLTSNVYSGLPDGVTVDVIAHPGGSRTMTVFGPYDTHLFHSDAAYTPPPGTDMVATHGSPYSTGVDGTFNVHQSVSADELASLAKQNGIGGCPVLLTGCNTGKAPDGFGLQFSNALGGQTVVAPTDILYGYPTGPVVGHYAPGTNSFVDATHPWRVYGDGGSWVP